jgi:hypothetical protein
MKYEFEGKGYKTMSELHREWFPTRSDGWVTQYVKAGCKTVAEVVLMSTKKEMAGRAKSVKSARSGIYRATNSSVVSASVKNRSFK